MSRKALPDVEPGRPCGRRRWLLSKSGHLAEWKARRPLVRLAVWLADRLVSGRTSCAWSTGCLLANSLAGRLVMAAYWLAVWWADRLLDGC